MQKATAMVAAVTIVAMVSTIETNRFGIQFCTPTWALPDPTWPIPDPTWALPDLSLGSSRSQPGLFQSSAEIWSTPADTWSKIMNWKHVAGKRTSKQANRLAHTQARLHLHFGSYSREGGYRVNNMCSTRFVCDQAKCFLVVLLMPVFNSFS